MAAPIVYTDYDAEAENIARRQKYAELLRDQASTALPTNRMVGNRAVPISWTEGLAQALKGYAGYKMGEKANEDRKALGASRNAALAAAMSSMPQARPVAQPTDQEGTGSFDMSGTAGPDLRLKAPTMADNAAWIGQLQGLGGTAVQQGMGMLGLQQKADEGALNRESRTLDRIMELERRTLDLAAKREEREEAARKVADLKRELQQSQQEHEKKMQATIIANRPPRAEPAPSYKDIIDPLNPNQMISVDTRKYDEAKYRGGDRSAVLGVAGKEPTAAKRSEKEDQGKELLSSELDNLRTYYTVLNDAKAIPSSGRGAASNAASWFQSSPLGQLGGRIVGTKEQDARNNIQSSRLRLVNAIKNATGMSAQQLNSNVELQTWLTSLTDPSRSFESNMEIIDKIEKAFMGSKKSAASPKPNEPRVVDW